MPSACWRLASLIWSAADKKRSALAEGGINQGAAEVAHPGEDEEETAMVGAGARRANKTARRR
jgi:hypothetical protein